MLRSAMPALDSLPAGSVGLPSNLVGDSA